MTRDELRTLWQAAAEAKAEWNFCQLTNTAGKTPDELFDLDLRSRMAYRKMIQTSTAVDAAMQDYQP